MSLVIYIAAPFSAPTAAERERNTRRAEALNLLAIRQGHAPICPHSTILRGGQGRDDVPEEREAGLSAMLAVLGRCDQVWALTRDDGSLSAGMQRELEHWANGPRPHPWIRRTWAEWSVAGAEEGT